MRLLFFEHGLHLAALTAVDTGGGPGHFPVLKEVVLLFDSLKAPALKSSRLCMPNCVLNSAFAIGIPYAGGVTHHVVVLECGGVNGVELGLVDVGLEYAFLEVVQHHVSARPTEVAPCLLMQPGPGFLAGLPDHATKAAPRVAQRCHEQAGFTVADGTQHAGGCALAVVDLHLLAGRKLQAVELFGLAVTQLGGKSLNGVVGAREAKLIDQVLVDGHGVAFEAQLGLDVVPVGLADGGAGQRFR